ncbi:ATP-binding protein [Streptomyces sp. NPDC047737]|jgi:anti-sigma regulatory factor (Ser/Thr protein kinase)|uniref:ATP-binding protein n=1 Tax=Streptomyces sp. NPDC047737 TaxID=3155740 RepID=UPI0033E7AC77
MVETGTGTLPTYTETLPRIPESARTARRLVDLALTVWDMNEVRDAAEMVVSELLANAVHHARCESVRLTVTRLSDSRVQVSVVDRSRAHPRRRAAGSMEESGRGLGIVNALAHGRWGVDSLAWGKRVWADLEVTSGE